MFKLLFVCTGNSCRSPMAECLMKALNTGWEVKSRGISAVCGQKASENASLAMAEFGLDLKAFRSSILTKDDMVKADLVLTMTYGHLRSINTKWPEFADKTHCIYDFAFGSKGEVSDPFGGDLQVYLDCAKELKELIDGVVKRISS